ncbi:ClpXP protease specificity-enhancing factor [Nitrosomonas sp.]|uniref:ClpXP protease specificity-enhancing factor n=1 Tax=Nitrosomonas sp. TaxID=42353 RepID=UPI0027239DD6|nr:ClpXP protease specificity-enhancing factor [Nitrosomonas sp.]MDO8894609.1 ClpXP protease specificity-enhancing factor [Nitrosomonas sp.]
MSTNSTKPYLIRSIYDWCIDSGFTPYVSVKADPDLDIPIEYVKNGEIVFNISEKAVHGLIINNDLISFTARFNGVSRQLEIPLVAVNGIFAKEVNQGIAFSSENKEGENQGTADNEQQNSTIQNSLTYQTKKTRKPNLRIIK